jgi:hypothetical protein
MRRHKRAIRGVALLTQWVKPFNTVKAYVFKAINTVHSGQLRNLGLTNAPFNRMMGAGTNIQTVGRICPSIYAYWDH